MTKRRHLDFYETPSWQTLALMRRVPRLHRVLEPAAGDLAIAHVLRAHGIDVVTNDLDTQRPTQFHYDATGPVLWGAAPDRAWVVSNPPFSRATEILENAVTHIGRVAALLRLSWLEPTHGRSSFLSRHPPGRLVVLPRTSYTGDRKTDSVTSAWCIWGGGEGPAIQVVTRAERDELVAQHERGANATPITEVSHA